MIPRSTTPRAAGALGAPNPPRHHLDATPTAAPLTRTSEAWRGRAVELARRHDWDRMATFAGRSVRGVDTYAVPSQRIAGLRYAVICQPSQLDIQGRQGIVSHSWRCECQQAHMGRPCTHVGAAIILAALRSEVVEATEAARVAGFTWSCATHAGVTGDGGVFYSVTRSLARQWDTVRVLWDARPGRNVVRWGACQEIACAHIGAVALRVAHDREQQRREREHEARFGEEPWEWRFSPATPLASPAMRRA